MSKREPKIAPCMFCDSECEVNGWGVGIIEWVECKNSDCEYKGPSCDTADAAIRAHNAMCRRLDPARVLMVLGGMKGLFGVRGQGMHSWQQMDHWRLCLDAAMDKIRKMETK